MAPAKTNNLKRKRKSTFSTPPNKQRRTEPEDQGEGDFWPVEKILEERPRKYLVEWEPNKTTGETYPASWVWKKDVTKDLIATWEASRAPHSNEPSEPSTPRSENSARGPQSCDSLSSSPGSPIVQDSQISNGSASYRPTATEASGSNREIPATQEALLTQESGSDEENRNTQDSSGSSAHIPRTQEASGSDGVISTTQESSGSNLYIPTTQGSGSVTGTLETPVEDSTLSQLETQNSRHSSPAPVVATSLSQSVVEEEDLGIEIPDTYSQGDDHDNIEIPESPAQEDPNSLEQQGSLDQAGTVVSPFEEGPESPAQDEPGLREQETTQEQSGTGASEENLQCPAQDELSSLEHQDTREYPGTTVRPSEQSTGSNNSKEDREKLAKPPTSIAEERITELEPASLPPVTDTLIEQHSPTPEVHATETYCTPVAVEQSQQAVPETVLQANQAFRDALQDLIPNGHHEETLKSPRHRPLTLSLELSGTEPEQNAQVVLLSPFVSTQQESADSIRPTTEVWDCRDSDLATPGSRHDSSQQSPVSITQNGNVPVVTSSDDLSIPPSPPHSIGTTGSTAPPRPRTPVDALTLSSHMAEPSKEEIIAKKFEAFFAEAHAKAKSRASETASPAAAGTRSPSMIPDRSPKPLGPSALRTAAFINSAAVPPPEAPPTISVPTIAPVIPEFSNVTHAANVDAEGSRVDSDSDDALSVLEDEIDLLSNEFIVPLSMEARQKVLFKDEFRRKQDVVKDFLAGTEDKPVPALVAVLETLEAVETHVDLLYTGSASQFTGPQTQAQWDSDSSVKFKFLGALLRGLREREMHVVVVLKEDNEQVFGILETFLKGQYLNYKYPAKDRAADLSEVEGPLTVTLLTADSDFIIQPPHVIVCLDTASTAEIRQKNWAVNPDRTVPVLQLVVPRSVSHIKLCISSKLDTISRLHTIIACLTQLWNDVGRPLVLETPRPVEAADMVAKYLVELEVGEDHPEWPLPPIHSIKDVIEYNPLLSQESRVSPVPRPTPGPSKRPLDDEHLDPAKRLRMTPNADAEVTHISDSMPGTAVEVSKLQEQLAEKQLALDKFKESAQRYRELEVIWDRRQTEFEDLLKQHRLLKSEVEITKTKLERANKVNEIANGRIDRLNTETSDLRTQFLDLQNLSLASEDDKIAEITRLKKELQEERTAKESAIKNKESTESTREYMKDQLYEAQQKAAEWKDLYEKEQAEAQRLKKELSGDVAAHKKIHLDRSFEALKQENELLKIDNMNKARLLEKKEDEVLKLKGEKKGYGTRQSSVPRSPRVGGPSSRAASPLPARDRVTHLRNA